MHFFPNVITAFGLACGLLLIFKTNLIDSGEDPYKVFKISVLLFAIAAFADFIDGLVARVIKAESEFGMFFDSLSDAITFGVAPSVVVLKSLSIPPGGLLSFCSALGAMLYSICGVLRLVRYNVHAPKKKSSQKKSIHFTGLPIPAAGGAAISLNFFLLSPLFQSYFFLNDQNRAVVLICALVLLAYLMISKWKFPALKTSKYTMPGAPLVIWSVICASVVVYGVLYNLPLLFVALSWGYVGLGWGLSMLRFLVGKKAKILKGFYPGDEDKK